MALEWSDMLCSCAWLDQPIQSSPDASQLGFNGTPNPSMSPFPSSSCAHTHGKAFRAALDENGAEFPKALSDKLWNLIKAMKVCGGGGTFVLNIDVCVGAGALGCKKVDM